jgi:hypothetical protein
LQIIWTGETMRDRINVLVEKRELDSLPLLLTDADLPSIRYAARRLAGALGDDGHQTLIDYVETLLASPALASRQLACQLIPHVYALERKQAVALLPQLIESEDWLVRDAACEVAGKLLRADFSRMIGELEAWRCLGSATLLRAIVIAAIRASDASHPERAEPLLRLIEPLLTEAEPAVRKNLGPSAIGTRLLAHYPTLTFEYLVKWSTSNDAHTLWNVAMAFSAPAAAPIAKKALIVLRKLSLDERHFVWRAVASALWKLGRKRPDIIRPELSRWLEDDQRINVARAAIKHL